MHSKASLEPFPAARRPENHHQEVATMTARTFLRTVAALAMLLAWVSTGRAADVTLPKTAADHEALAKQYDEKAAQYRKDAAEHRDMAAAARKFEEEMRSHPTAESKAAASMAKHCGSIMKDADKLAVDAESAAKFHRMRAKELAGP
jgi:uncharacterized membrane protein YccC